MDTRRWIGEKRVMDRREESRGMIGGPHRHVPSNSTKPPRKKIARLPNVNGFESWVPADDLF